MTFKSQIIFTENSEIQDSLLSEVVVRHGYDYVIHNHAGLYIIHNGGIMTWDEGMLLHKRLQDDLNGHVNIIWKMLYVEY